MFITRTHAAFIAAVRLPTGGFMYETCPVLRVGIELAWYALHITKDPEGTKRARIWLCRDDSQEALKAFTNEFQVGRVRTTHEAHDAASAKQLHELYKTMINYGVKPNHLGMMTGLGRTQEPGTTTFLLSLLSVEELPMVLATRMAVAVSVGGLHVFRLIFPERVAIAGLRRDIDILGEKPTPSTSRLLRGRRRWRRLGKRHKISTRTRQISTSDSCSERACAGANWCGRPPKTLRGEARRRPE
jgi:hypothetical protein